MKSDSTFRWSASRSAIASLRSGANIPATASTARETSPFLLSPVFREPPDLREVAREPPPDFADLEREPEVFEDALLARGAAFAEDRDLDDPDLDDELFFEDELFEDEELFLADEPFDEVLFDEDFLDEEPPVELFFEDEPDPDPEDFEPADFDEPNLDGLFFAEPDFDELDLDADDFDFEPEEVRFELDPEGPGFLLDDFLLSAILFPPNINRSIETDLAITIPSEKRQLW